VKGALAAAFALLLAATAPAAPSEDTTRKAIGAAIETCTDDVLGLSTDAAEAQVATVKKRLEERKNQRAPAVPPAAPAPADPSPAAVVQAEAEIQWVKTLRAQAAQALQAARAAPDASVARVHLKDAQDKLQSARTMIARATERVGIEPAAPGGGTPIAPRLDLHIENSAFRQLLRSAEAGQRAEGRAAVGESADARDYDAGAESLVVPGGRSIDVRTLRGAFRQVTGTAAPLFERVPEPGGGAPVYRLTAPAREALAAPATRAQLENVGGVELQVTLDLLGYLGLPDFRKRGPATFVESPVLVSLAELATRLQAHAGAWGELPEALRYPGGIERVHGFVLDAQRRDVVLVGARARGLETRLDVDLLIVALQSVWQEGLTPGVSLDALPENPGGPQYSRVIGVPPTSRFARVMLDADYAMKRVMMDDLRVTVPGFRSYAQVMAAQPSALPRERFWFYPAALGAGDVHVSATARTILFDTGVRLLTESQRVVAGGYVGTGDADQHALRAAESFTAAYDAIERAAAVEPRGIFVALHGLVDLVTTAKIWREMGLDYPALKVLAGLPVRRLQGAEAVPAYYPGVTRVYARTAIGQYTITGGVLARARASRRSLDRYRDVTTATLERAVDQFPRGQGFAQPLAFRFSLPRGGADVRSDAEHLVIAGQAALVQGRYDDARSRLAAATAADPFDADAWAYLGQAQAMLNRHRDAAASVARALELEPTDTMLRLIALDVALRADSRLDLRAYDENVRRLLGEDYAAQAQAALGRSQIAEARRLADRALALSSDNADASAVRALTWPDLASADAARDWIEAIRGYRRRVRAGDDTAKRPLAFALTMRAVLRLEHVELGPAAQDAGRAQQILDELQRVVDEAREARQLDDGEPLAPATEARARALRVAVFEARGQSGNLAVARGLADATAARFADFSPAHFARAVVLRVADEPAGAVAALTETLRLDPTDGGALRLRAHLYAEAGRCTDARADLERARALGVSIAPAIREVVDRCR
jgi:tetratricopeptide (TPR) repeat protein